MNRVVPTIGLLYCVSAAAHAQGRPEAVVQLREDGRVPELEVSIRGLLSDGNFVRAMQSGFPLYLEYRVELRSERSGWFDATIGEDLWEFVVSFDPVRERYAIEDADGRREVEGERGLRAAVEQVLLFDGLVPPDPGEYYFAATIAARTLSDEDVDEVFDLLRGDDDGRRSGRPGLVARAARRLLVRVAPLPRLDVSARTATFRWR